MTDPDAASPQWALAPGQDRDTVLGQLRQLETMGSNVTSHGWGPDGATVVHRAFLDFDERGQNLLRRAYASRGPLQRFQTSQGQALRFTPPPREALVRSVLLDVEDKTEQLRTLITALVDPWAFEHQEAQAVYTPAGTGIFLVHGRNAGVKETVARFLERATPGPVIILHEQPNAGATIMEKLERHSEVAFAVVLLTGDDLVTVTGADRAEHRARQNVIAELGWFSAKLGRARVCALYQPGVVLPSDWDGVLYVLLEGEGWRAELLRELAAAGIPVRWEALG